VDLAGWAEFLCATVIMCTIHARDESVWRRKK
jgi:hypothetical protein